MLIYLVTNRINGKIYVGQTTYSIKVRWKHHVLQATRSKAKMLLYSAIRKYGPESFFIEEIDQAESREELNKLEIYHIKRLNAAVSEIGYNISPGGIGSGPHLQSVKDKISKSLTGRKRSPAAIAKAAAAITGHKVSLETRKKISDANKGKAVPLERRQLISATLTGRRLSEEHKKNIGIASLRRAPQSRISETQFTAIAADNRKLRVIAEQYGISVQYVCLIRKGWFIFRNGKIVNIFPKGKSYVSA